MLADSLGTADDGTPATAEGESCRISIATAWLPSAYGDHAVHKRLLCTVFAHERAHAELDRRHAADPGDLMYYGPLTVVLPECAARFPAPSDGFVKPGFGSVPQPAPPPGADSRPPRTRVHPGLGRPSGARQGRRARRDCTVKA